MKEMKMIVYIFLLLFRFSIYIIIICFTLYSKNLIIFNTIHLLKNYKSLKNRFHSKIHSCINNHNKSIHFPFIFPNPLFNYQKYSTNSNYSPSKDSIRMIKILKESKIKPKSKDSNSYQLNLPNSSSKTANSHTIKSLKF